MWWSDYFPMPFMFFGPALMIIFIVVCFAMMFFMMRGMMGHRSHGRDALDILRERYARGEITQAEYEERRRFLGA
jgi:putative membrane protein